MDAAGDHHNVDYVATEVFESRYYRQISPAAQILTAAIWISSRRAAQSVQHHSPVRRHADIAGTLDNVGERDTGHRLRTWNPDGLLMVPIERFVPIIFTPTTPLPSPRSSHFEALSVYYFVGASWRCHHQYRY